MHAINPRVIVAYVCYWNSDNFKDMQLFYQIRNWNLVYKTLNMVLGNSIVGRILGQLNVNWHVYGIQWTDEYSQMRWKHTLLLTLNELTLILIMQKGYKMLPASVISALAPTPVSLCGWLVSGPSPGSRCSRSSRCCRDWCRWRGTSGRAWGRSPAPASCCPCAAPSRPHQQGSAAGSPAPPGSKRTK